MIDLTTEFGRRVAQRLAEERIIWLTTMDAAGFPQPKSRFGFGGMARLF
jgi:hypothetical protein